MQDHEGMTVGWWEVRRQEKTGQVKRAEKFPEVHLGNLNIEGDQVCPSHFAEFNTRVTNFWCGMRFESLAEARRE